MIPLILTWEDFDKAIKQSKIPDGCPAIYGHPRGGLTLAVALSHQHNIPLVSGDYVYRDNTLFVDDIADTGRTIRIFTAASRFKSWVWVKRKSCPADVDYVLEVEDGKWIVFPWENKQRVIEDYEKYLSRK